MKKKLLLSLVMCFGIASLTGCSKNPTTVEELVALMEKNEITKASSYDLSGNMYIDGETPEGVTFAIKDDFTIVISNTDNTEYVDFRNNNYEYIGEKPDETDNVSDLVANLLNGAEITMYVDNDGSSYVKSSTIFADGNKAYLVGQSDISSNLVDDTNDITEYMKKYGTCDFTKLNNISENRNVYNVVIPISDEVISEIEANMKEKNADFSGYDDNTKNMMKSFVLTVKVYTDTYEIYGYTLKADDIDLLSSSEDMEMMEYIQDESSTGEIYLDFTFDIVLSDKTYTFDTTDYTILDNIEFDEFEEVFSEEILEILAPLFIFN